jgi:cobalt-zinc-cadmium efflux system outer membrane protein
VFELAMAGSELASARKRLASQWGNPGPRFERAEGSLDVLPPLLALDDLNSRLGYRAQFAARQNGS